MPGYITRAFREEEGLRGLESDSRVSYKRAASATNAELKSVESRVKNVARHAKARAAKVYSKIDELEGEIRGLKAKERKARLRLRTAREEAVEDTHTMTSDLEREVQKASRAMRRDGRREVKNYEVPHARLARSHSSAHPDCEKYFR